MATPMSTFAEAAHRFGGIDPNDEAAVDKFFDELVTLTQEEQQQILSFLIEHDGEPDTSPPRRNYAKGHVCPALDDVPPPVGQKKGLG